MERKERLEMLKRSLERDVKENEGNGITISPALVAMMETVIEYLENAMPVRETEDGSTPSVKYEWECVYPVTVVGAQNKTISRGVMCNINRYLSNGTQSKVEIITENSNVFRIDINVFESAFTYQFAYRD